MGCSFLIIWTQLACSALALSEAHVAEYIVQLYQNDLQIDIKSEYTAIGSYATDLFSYNGQQKMSTQDLIGLTEQEAQDYLQNNQVMHEEQQITTVRVIKQDGEDFMVTMDFCENRVNVEVEDGKITKIRSVKQQMN